MTLFAPQPRYHPIRSKSTNPPEFNKFENRIMELLDELDNVALPLPNPALYAEGDDKHAPRILILCGSLRIPSYSRFAAYEAERVLRYLGAEVRVFDPTGLPPPDTATDAHPKVVELRELAIWSEGMVWSSPERHGAMTGLMKSQIDWLPLSSGGVRPTQGKTLAVMQVCGGSQSFNTVNQMRLLGRWMRMITIPNQSSIPMAWREFDGKGQMRPSSYQLRIVDVMEELMKFTILTRGHQQHLTDRYSERVEAAAKRDRPKPSEN